LVPRLSASHSFMTAFLVLTVSACTSIGSKTVSSNGIYDPYEKQNRQIHEFNKSIDKALVRPAALGYTSIIPDEIEDSVSNFSRNLSSPSIIVNSLLQGDLNGAGVGTFRFTMNSTIGFLGLFDPASIFFDIQEHDADFGETLYVWGVGEGAYLELPFLGPSNQRDTVGMLVDFFTNPLSYVGLDSPEKYFGAGSRVARGLSSRGRYSDAVDSILYESADSYSQARLMGTQNRRFELGDENANVEADPFALDTEGF
jgi:phospholipid-binding lipoprotein MlaA